MATKNELYYFCVGCANHLSFPLLPNLISETTGKAIEAQNIYHYRNPIFEDKESEEEKSKAKENKDKEDKEEDKEEVEESKEEVEDKKESKKEENKEEKIQYCCTPFCSECAEEGHKELIEKIKRGAVCCNECGKRVDSLEYILSVVLLRAKTQVNRICCSELCYCAAQKSAQDMEGLLNKNTLHMCEKCRSLHSKTFTCGSCGKVEYCGEKCQREHWPEHKKYCWAWKILADKEKCEPPKS